MLVGGTFDFLEEDQLKWIVQGGGRARHRDLRPHKGSDSLAAAFKQHQLPVTRPEVAVLFNSRQGIPLTRPRSVKLESFCPSQHRADPQLETERLFGDPNEARGQREV